jgi:hypothetical protein
MGAAPKHEVAEMMSGNAKRTSARYHPGERRELRAPVRSGAADRLETDAALIVLHKAYEEYFCCA